MQLRATLAWSLSDDPSGTLDPRLLPLLQAVAATGSLAAAVGDRELSYRAAWGLLRAYRRRLGAPLVMLAPGRARLRRWESACWRLTRRHGVGWSFRSNASRWS